MKIISIFLLVLVSFADPAYPFGGMDVLQGMGQGLSQSIENVRRLQEIKARQEELRMQQEELRMRQEQQQEELSIRQEELRMRQEELRMKQEEQRMRESENMQRSQQIRQEYPQQSTSIPSNPALFFEQLDVLSPGWKIINTDKNFNEWLNEQEPGISVTRRQILRAAYLRRDVKEVSDMFNYYISLQYNKR
jgi:hypothetical protein